jgi:hypothetical protein
MSVRPLLAVSLAFGAALAAASCGGGPKHVAEITPAVAGSVSGIWVLNEQESDDPEEAMAAGRPGRAGAGPEGGPPQGGGRRPAGGGMPGGRGGMPGEGPGGGVSGQRPGGRPGGSGNAAAAQTLHRMATVVPRRLELSFSDSAVVVTYPREEPWLLPFGEGVKRKTAEEVEVEGKAEWKDGLLAVTRKVSGAGSVTETFYPTPDRHRLTVSVAYTMGQMGEVEFRRVYQPEAATQRVPPR